VAAGVRAAPTRPEGDFCMSGGPGLEEAQQRFYR